MFHGMTADDRLVLVRVKIERAKEHLRAMEESVRSFKNEKLTIVLSSTNPKGGQSQHFASPPVRPFDVLTCAGDLVHNLRGALDHLANQLVWIGSGAEPSRRVEFPIAKDEPTYE